MVQINFAQKEIQCKIVYYGPGMSGKTTNLELVHAKAPDDHRGELTSIATTGERTLYFDYMPLDLGQIAGISTKFQLYTVPGQIYYKSTRRLVLQGVDGIVFVADSSESKLRENKESMADLEDNLREMGKTLDDVPIVVQYNKRDLPDAMDIEQLEAEINVHGFPHTEGVASRGDGVFPTLKLLASMVLEAVNKGGLATARARTTRRPAKAAAGAVAAPAPAGVSAASGSGSVVKPPSPPPPAPRGAAHGAAHGAGPFGKPGAHPPTGATHGGPPPSPISPRKRASVTVPPRPVTPARDMEERLVSVGDLGGDGPNTKLLLMLTLGALIAGAGYFVATHF